MRKVCNLDASALVRSTERGPFAREYLITRNGYQSAPAIATKRAAHATRAFIENPVVRICEDATLARVTFSSESETHPHE
jgi:hypothetical protein